MESPRRRIYRVTHGHGPHERPGPWRSKREDRDEARLAAWAKSALVPELIVGRGVDVTRPVSQGAAGRQHERLLCARVSSLFPGGLTTPE
jgi:hypothetical protein